MFYVFLLVIAVLGIGIYLLFILPSVPGAVEERFGVLEPLPKDLGVWQADDESEAGKAARERGEIREVRLLFDEQKSRLTRQARYRSASSDEVVRIDPEEVVKRRRIKPA